MYLLGYFNTSEFISSLLYDNEIRCSGIELIIYRMDMKGGGGWRIEEVRYNLKEVI